MESLKEKGYAMRTAPESEVNMFYARTKTEYESEGYIGYLRIDFGSSGTEFWHTWHPFNDGLNNECFKQDFYPMVDLLREGPLHSMSEMCKFIDKNGGRLQDSCNHFGYIIESDHYRYFAKFIPCKGDYNGYVFAYVKSNTAVEHKTESRKTNVKISFDLDFAGIETEIFELNVPKDITEETINEIIRKAHEYLEKQEDENCLYEKDGRNAYTLINYVCKEQGWEYKSFEPDMEIELN